MKRIFSSPSLIQAAQFKDFLEQEGIPCVMKNELLGGLSPEVPWTETFPEVWVQNDADLEKALNVKADWLSLAEAAADSEG